MKRQFLVFDPAGTTSLPLLAGGQRLTEDESVARSTAANWAATNKKECLVLATIAHVRPTTPPVETIEIKG